MPREIILDSSTLISISEKCMSKIITQLSEKEGIVFIIPESVYYESVKHPMEIKRFEFNAIRINEMVKKGIIKIANSDAALKETMEKIKECANSIYHFDGQSLHILHDGECEMLALAKNRNVNVLAVDERTTRMLVENPQPLRNFLARRYGTNLKIDSFHMDLFKQYVSGISVILRSVELISLAYDRNCFDGELPTSPEALESALFALKYAGCAVSADEILRYMRERNEN